MLRVVVSFLPVIWSGPSPPLVILKYLIKSKKSFSEIKAEIDAKKINKDKLLGTKGVQKTNALLMESNKILMDIASVISTDFTTRIDGEKQELRDLQSKRQKGEVAEKEGKLEGKGQSTNKISAAAQKMMQPIMGAFDKIKELVSIIGLGTPPRSAGSGKVRRSSGGKWHSSADLSLP